MPLRVYLDQCAASEISKKSEWRELRAFLESAAERGALLCPLPFDTILESSRCGSPETREAIFSFFRNVSGGWIFRQFFDILTDELLSIVRLDHSVSAFDYTQEIDRLCGLSAEIQPVFEKLRRERNTILGTWMDDLMPPSMGFGGVLEVITLEPVARLWRDLRQIASSPNFYSLSNFECPKITDSLLKNCITAKEADELAEKLRHHAMNSIPIQFFHNRLAAAASHLQLQRPEAKFDYNDIIDQERLSVALAFSDFAVTDRSMAARVEFSGVCDLSACKIFKVSDLLEFEQALRAKTSL